MQQTGARRIVDLCSGAGGPWGELLKDGWDVTVTLTDRYPNLAAFASAQACCPERLAYRTEPVDARQLPADLDGMRILFNSFHHFRPCEAREILADAVARRAPIGIFEVTELTPGKLLAVFSVLLLALAAAPFARPLSLSRLFWTWCVPLVPLCLFWDGLVSLVRAYTPAELAELAAVASSDDYRWEAGRIVPPWPGVPVTYLIGFPKTP
jgi:SAM-dependent methyltransferase